MSPEVHSFVGYTFTATLETYIPLKNKKGEDKTSIQTCTVQGKVYPSPYHFAEALAAVLRRLEPLTLEKWRIIELNMSGGK